MAGTAYEAEFREGKSRERENDSEEMTRKQSRP